MPLPFGLKAELPKCAQRLLASGFGFLGMAGSAGVTAGLASPEHAVAAGVAGAVAVTAGLLVNEFHKAYHDSREEARAHRNHLVRRGMARALSQALRVERSECRDLFPPDLQNAVFEQLPRLLQKAVDGDDNALLDNLFPLDLSEDAWNFLNRYEADLEPASLKQLTEEERGKLLEREEEDQAALAMLLRNLPVPESGEEEIRSYLARLADGNCERQVEELAIRLLPQFRIEFAVVFSEDGPESRAIEYKHEKFTREALLRIEARLKDMGQHVLHTESRVEEIYAILIGGAANIRSARKPQNLPFGSLGSLFKGREGDMDALAEQLKKKGATAIVQPASITGMGGVGKTRLAIEYALKHEGEFAALLFVTASTPEELANNFSLLSGPEVLNLPAYLSGKQPEQYAAVLQWLQASTGWLLILDNADTKEAIKAVQQLVPRIHGGQVIITSRISEWGGSVHALDLELLSEEASVSYLIERTAADRQRQAGEESEARALADELGGLALALEQAAAYVNARGISLAEYRRRWRESNEKLIDYRDELAVQYPKSVAVTFLTSFEEISPDARRLLNILAWLAPDPIPLSLLETGGGPFAAEDPEGVQEGQRQQQTEEAEEALADLARFSLAARSADKAAFSVHRLVQTVARRNQDRDEQHQSVAAALRWVNSGFTGSPQDVRLWPVLEPLAVHVRVVADEADGRSIPDPTARLMNQLGVFLYSRAEWGQAEPMFRRVASIFEKSLGPDHPDVATALNNLAGLLRATNRLAEAEPLMRRALAIDEKSCGPDHPNVAIRLNNLAGLLEATSRLADAEPMYRRALAIWENSLGPDHPQVATALNNLAGLLRATNRLAEAEPMYRRALAIDEQSYGPDHPKVATRLNNLAALLEDTNRLAEAEPMYRSVVSIFEKNLGPDHPNVATALNNLALLLKATNRFAQAEPMYRRALAIDERSYGPDHPDVARDLNNLAALLRATNRLAEAEPMYRRAMAIWENSLGPDHPQVAAALNNLAALLQATNRLAEAEPMYRRALAIRESSFGPDHPDVAQSLNNLAGLLEAADRFAEAEPMVRRALAIDEQSYGPDHPSVAIRLNNLARLLQATNRLAEAEPMVRRALAIRVKFSRDTGHVHPHLQDTVNGYARLLGEMGMNQEQVLAKLREMAPEFFK